VLSVTLDGRLAASADGSAPAHEAAPAAISRVSHPRRCQ